MHYVVYHWYKSLKYSSQNQPKLLSSILSLGRGYHEKLIAGLIIMAIFLFLVFASPPLCLFHVHVFVERI